MTQASKEKQRFRNTSRWKSFRRKMSKACGAVDFITGKPLRKGWQLHHCDMSLEHYKNLDPENFVCLNKKSHDLIHFLYRYDNYKEVLKQIDIVLTKMHELNKADDEASNNEVN